MSLIRNFGLINIKPQNFKLNKFNQNPIIFKGNIPDTFERQEDREKSDFYKQEKARVEGKVNAKINYYNKAIRTFTLEKEKLQKEHDILEKLLYSDEFLTKIKPAIKERQEQKLILQDKINTLSEDQEKIEYELNGKFELIDINHTDLKKLIKRYNYKDGSKVDSKDLSNQELYKLGLDTLHNVKLLISRKKSSLLGLQYQSSEITTIAAKILKKENNLKESDAEYLGQLIASIIHTSNEEIEKSKIMLDDRFQIEENAVNQKINAYEKRKKDLKQSFNFYLDILQNKPYLAPYYEPLLKSNEILNILKNDKENFKYLPKEKFNINITLELKKMGLLNNLDGFEDLYDTNDPTNKETFDILFKDDIKIDTLSAIAKMYHIPLKDVRELPLNLTEFKNETSENPLQLVKLTDENKGILEEELKRNKKITPKKSKYCYGFCYEQKNKEIPASELKKMGYSNIASLRKMVEQGILDGRIEEVDTLKGKKYRTFINLQSENNIQKFHKIMEKAPVLTLAELSKEIGVSQKDLKEYIKDGDLDIIDEYLFIKDSETIRVDKRNPKTQDFIQKIQFEKELKEQLKQEEKLKKQEEIKVKKQKELDLMNKIKSLRMKLVWHFCPKTRNVASALALNNGYLSKIIEKDEDNKELSKQEEVVLKTYNRSVWNNAGVDELKEAFKKANELIELYNSNGIDSIEDEEIKEMFKEYFN